jgi:FkbM family methyltransferase
MRVFYGRLLAPGDLSFDIGANVGERTRTFLSLGARVVAVEPQASCLRLLHAAFGHDPRVEIVATAVGAREGTAELAICEAASTISTLSEKWRTVGRFAGEYTWDRTEQVSVTTLDALLATYGVPRFCKIDTEGFDLQVVLGLSRPIPALSFEFTREFFDDARAAAAPLDGLGRWTYNASVGEGMAWFAPDWLSGSKLLECLANDPTPSLWGDVYARSV